MPNKTLQGTRQKPRAPEFCVGRHGRRKFCYWIGQFFQPVSGQHVEDRGHFQMLWSRHCQKFTATLLFINKGVRIGLVREYPGDLEIVRMVWHDMHNKKLTHSFSHRKPPNKAVKPIRYSGLRPLPLSAYLGR